MKWFARLTMVAAGIVLSGTANAAPVPADKSKPVDLVLCLDVSGSMNGLIDSAKLKLWDIVNELAKAKPTPYLRVALYSYGASNYAADKGWVRKEIDLTNDLDEVYSKLNALRTGGGDEYVARAAKTALEEQKWDEGKDSLRIIFVCGNEAATQDPQVSLEDAAALAKKKSVIVNTIYCHPLSNPESKAWRDFATMNGGAFANIDQGQAAKDVALSIKTPVDGELLKLNEQLNTTYVTYGAKGGEKALLQKTQDTAAAANAPGAALARAESKANALYRNDAWDLIDRMKNDPKFDIKTLKEEELCDDMKKLKPEEREGYLKKKAEERATIQKKINELSATRSKIIDEERKKQPKSDSDKALDEALKGIIREQSKAKGFEVPAAPEKK